MTRRNYSSRPLRSLDRELVIRALVRGGMVLDVGGVWTVYRGQDARRMQVGRVTPELAEALVAEGAAIPVCGEPARLCAGPAARA